MALFRLDRQGPLRTEDQLVTRTLEVVHLHTLAVLTRRQQRRLVDQVSQIGARKTRGASGNFAKIDIITELHLAHMHLEDSLAVLAIRKVQHDMTVEPPGSQQCGIEHVRPVGRREHDNSLVSRETVHLGKYLVQCLFPLVMTATKSGTAGTADAVEFIDEEDTGRLLPGSFEQLSDA